MDIKYIKLQNFKGFKEATLKLKPLTVILGPNSSGKSSFGQALVALSKSHARKGVLSLAFGEDSSVEFGNYSTLVHSGCYGQPVTIEVGLESGSVILNFREGNKLAGISDLDLSSIKYEEGGTIVRSDHRQVSGSSSQEIKIALPLSEINDDSIKELIRNNISDWTVYKRDNDAHTYKLLFNGAILISASELTETIVDVNKAVPGFTLRSQLLASLLRSISYLRPDRVPPKRWRKAIDFSATEPFIDDWGQGTDWFINKNRDVEFETFFFPPQPIDFDKEKSKETLEKYEGLMPNKEKLLPALTKWLDELGLASFLDINLLDGEQVIQVVATPKGQEHARPLIDVGFGLSQVLPILAKGLSLEKSGLLVVEQPEAQLHPKPQAVLADFFCSMVKCTRNVIVETHSVELFHRLRLRASMDPKLAEKIGVYFLHEPETGVCCEPELISLNEEDELRWPRGFLPEGIQKEMEILSMRLARKGK